MEWVIHALEQCAKSIEEQKKRCQLTDAAYTAAKALAEHNDGVLEELIAAQRALTKLTSDEPRKELPL